MSNKIKEFIKAFKDAYNTINIDKNNARNAIDDFKKEVDDIEYITESLKIIFSRLEAVYICFPIKERQDFIQKTLDLLRYGRKDSNGGLKDICGWYSLYSSQADYAKTRLNWLNECYTAGKYDEVISLAKEYKQKINEFNVLYGIEETQNEENE